MTTSAASVMRRQSRVRWVLRCGLLAAGLLAATGGLAQPQPQVEITAPASAPEAEARAREVVDLINSGDPAVIEAYVRANVEPSATSGPGAPSSTPTAFLARLHYQSRGAVLDHVKPTSVSSVTARYRNALTGRLSALHVKVAPESGKIVELAPRRAVQPNAAAGANDAARLAPLEAMVKRMADADYFSGVVMIAKNDKPIFAKAYGMADRERRIPNTLDTSFNIGSMNKLFTAVAVAQLVERGKLSYEDPLSKFMPDFPDPDSAKRIKIKHLLSHTSGLRNYFNQAFSSSPVTRFRGMDAYLAVAKESGLLFEPGSRWSYSNTGMLVAGRVVEIVTGQSYYDYVREHIYKPAGMIRTDSYEADRGEAWLARGYDTAYDNGVPEVRDTADIIPVRGSPAGGGFAMAADLVRFAHAFRTGKLTSAESVAAMTSPKPELNSPRYGYGVDLGRLVPAGRDIVGHGGDAPGTCAIFDMVRDTPEPYTIVILSNGNSVANCHPVAQQAYDLFAPTNIAARAQ